MPWQVSGYESLGTFDSQEAAVAAAWSVTPPGGKRPEVAEAVWSVVGTAAETGLALHGSADEKTDSLSGVLTHLNAVMEKDSGSVVYEATVSLPLAVYERALGSLSQKDAQKELERELARKAGEAAGRALVPREVSITVDVEAPELSMMDPRAFSAPMGMRARVVVTGRLVEALVDWSKVRM